jgi:hypothetical protein
VSLARGPLAPANLAALMAALGLPDTDDLTLPVLEAAEAFAARELAPGAAARDAAGCALRGRRVQTHASHRAAWAAFRAAGWPGLGAPAAGGGQDLPAPLCAAVQAILDGADPAFGMLPINLRAAAVPIAQGGVGLAAEWLPQLASGTWGATICVSEAEAGSDLARVRTRAVAMADGWRIDGEKSWISYGDHDLTPRIGHVVLARTGAEPGTRGLSAFLVAVDDADRNGVAVTRLEHKLGLHASPTCALVFDGARAALLGAPGQGMRVLFGMIRVMRLAVAVQGAAIAAAAVTEAAAYAGDRRQGGPPEAPPVPIAQHGEVRRLLLAGACRALGALGLALGCAAMARDPDGLALWLPVAKTLGAEAAFLNAHDAIQVFGGVGFTRDAPAERRLRDSRVLAIYEGTTAIQALDLLRRQLRGGQAARLRGELAAMATLGAPASHALAALEHLLADEEEAGAVPFLRLLGRAATARVLALAARARLDGADALLAFHQGQAEDAMLLDQVRAPGAALFDSAFG